MKSWGLIYIWLQAAARPVMSMREGCKPSTIPSWTNAGCSLPRQVDSKIGVLRAQGRGNVLRCSLEGFILVYWQSDALLTRMLCAIFLQH